VLWLEPRAPGGEYALTVRDAFGRFAPQTRKFVVHSYSRHRLAKTLDFSRSSYGPGDTVLATCRATRAEGGPLPECPVRATLTVDGRAFQPDGRPGERPFAGRTDADGTVLVRFKLPRQIERGQASLTVTFDDGGPESLTRTVPVVLKKLEVEFFPEGGDLVAGLPARVYFQVRTPLGKPADLVARLLE